MARGCVVIAAIVAFPMHVVAQNAAGEAPTDPPTEALELFEDSLELYRQGEFSAAAQLLERAYSLAPEPVLLYNLGRAREGYGDLEAAVDAYQRYLDTAGDIPDRGAIEAKIETLTRLVAEQSAQEPDDDTAGGGAESAPVHRGPPPTPGGPSPVPWTIAAFGAGGLIAGSIVGAMAQSTYSSADGAASQMEAAAQHQTAVDFALAANITLAVGGVLLLAGLVWGVIDLLSQGETEVYSFSPRGLEGRF